MNHADQLILLTLNEALSPEALLAMARKAVESEFEGERAVCTEKLKSLGHDPHDIIRKANEKSTTQPRPKAPRSAKPERRPETSRPKTTSSPPPSSPPPGSKQRKKTTGKNPEGEWGNPHEKPKYRPGFDPETIRRNRRDFDDKIKKSNDQWSMNK